MARGNPSAAERIERRVREASRRAVRQVNDFNEQFHAAITALAEQNFAAARSAIDAMEAIWREQDAEEAAAQARVDEVAHEAVQFARRKATVAKRVAAHVGQRVRGRISGSPK